ncbi:MAG: hypothetical protein MUF64_04150 [Polyangiaceae bacterium]|jgi:hypothetical protein|nr:hypothetical protein [Polyangiaceae bacterium]
MKIPLPFLLFVTLGACSESERGGGTSPLPLGARDVLWIDTGPVEHTRDYASFEEFCAPEVPKDWTRPIPYADGSFTLRVEVLALSNPAAQPIFYTVGWKRPIETEDPEDAEYIRMAVKIDRGVGVYEQSGEIKNLSRVINGKDAGPVGEGWDWTNAWGSPNGDAFDIGPEDPYPLTVRVSLVLRPPAALP